MMRLALVALATALVTACSSDPGASSGSSSSSSGVACSFSGTLTGGVTGTISANACASSGGSTFAITQADIVTGTSLGARFEVVTALKGGELGVIPLRSFEVFQREGKGAASLEWSSTSCTLTLEKNEASPTTVFTNRFLLAGRGSCSAPLDATPPNTRPAVTVSTFEMTAFVDPR